MIKPFSDGDLQPGEQTARMPQFGRRRFIPSRPKRSGFPRAWAILGLGLAAWILLVSLVSLVWMTVLP